MDTQAVARFNLTQAQLWLRSLDADATDRAEAEAEVVALAAAVARLEARGNPNSVYLTNGGR
jgi:hypothetical protein